MKSFVIAVALFALAACRPIAAPQETSMTTTAPVTPVYVTDLQAVFGPPSQAGFGSAVFYAPAPDADSLEQMALAQYKTFVGELWARYGEEAWMGPWRQVYARSPGAPGNIAAELRALPDRGAALSASVMLEGVDAPERAQAALAAAFDDPVVSELAIFTLGDGGAMSGLLIAGQRQDRSAIFLAFLLD